MKTYSRVVGMHFHPGAGDKLMETPEGYTVVLCREPENPHDPNAIACKIDRVMVGYVPRDMAVDLAKKIDAGTPVDATLIGYNGLEIEIGELAEVAP